jgi:hypothetical protein
MESRHPELKWLHSSNNGVNLGNTPRERAIRGHRMKLQGLKPGVSDICLPVRRGIFSGLYVELKSVKGSQTKEQLEFGAFVTGEGFLFSVCKGWQSAADTIENYLNQKG